ncbi:uncharacterized protein LOC119687881 [Teleopsis dalmanni]|uniref:uncharacterized protein LOC119687881 n=1 Tax=Teleopsis dalmanni TaxID=139649 RepID=UPI0018CF7041|nr:uncharacterized protein LOC119687881 [Teleopsis dalmanni]
MLLLTSVGRPVCLNSVNKMCSRFMAGCKNTGCVQEKKCKKSEPKKQEDSCNKSCCQKKDRCKPPKPKKDDYCLENACKPLLKPKPKPKKEYPRDKCTLEQKLKCGVQIDECCKVECPDVVPRYDDLYYCTSDKAKRKYTQTWIECPELRRVKKVVCCYENLKMPKFEKRCRGEVPQTACSTDREDRTLMECGKEENPRCARITSRCCRPSRYPPKCNVDKYPTHCVKCTTPYPSFSECKRERPSKPHPKECNCLEIPALCDIYAELRKRKGKK